LDSNGIILIDDKPSETSINGTLYEISLKDYDMLLKKKKTKGKRAVCVLLHDNAPGYKSRVAQASICECKFEQSNHPSYSVPGTKWLLSFSKFEVLLARDEIL
jgi:hypothetical protein